MVNQVASATNVPEGIQEAQNKPDESVEVKTVDKTEENVPEVGKKKFYQNWWFWVIVVAVVLGVFVAISLF